MILERLLNRLKNANNKLIIIISVIVSLQFFYTLIEPYLENSTLSRFRQLEKNLIVATKALDAEMEIDKWVLKKEAS